MGGKQQRVMETVERFHMHVVRCLLLQLLGGPLLLSVVSCTCLVLPAVLPCLLALADSSKPAKLQEAVADGLCALASQDWAQKQLVEAGAPPQH
jgi:hypothetical protein